MGENQGFFYSIIYTAFLAFSPTIPKQRKYELSFDILLKIKRKKIVLALPTSTPRFCSDLSSRLTSEVLYKKPIPCQKIIYVHRRLGIRVK